VPSDIQEIFNLLALMDIEIIIIIKAELSPDFHEEGEGSNWSRLYHGIIKERNSIARF
jgi:hypothetical protein